jgi:hypothetical protein
MIKFLYAAGDSGGSAPDNESAKKEAAKAESAEIKAAAKEKARAKVRAKADKEKEAQKAKEKAAAEKAKAEQEAKEKEEYEKAKKDLELLDVSGNAEQAVLEGLVGVDCSGDAFSGDVTEMLESGIESALTNMAVDGILNVLSGGKIGNPDDYSDEAVARRKAKQFDLDDEMVTEDGRVDATGERFIKTIHKKIEGEEAVESIEEKEERQDKLAAKREEVRAKLEKYDYEEMQAREARIRRGDETAEAAGKVLEAASIAELAEMRLDEKHSKGTAARIDAVRAAANVAVAEAEFAEAERRYAAIKVQVEKFTLRSDILDLKAHVRTLESDNFELGIANAQLFSIGTEYAKRAKKEDPNDADLVILETLEKAFDLTKRKIERLEAGIDSLTEYIKRKEEVLNEETIKEAVDYINREEDEYARIADEAAGRRGAVDDVIAKARKAEAKLVKELESEEEKEDGFLDRFKDSKLIGELNKAQKVKKHVVETCSLILDDRIKDAETDIEAAESKEHWDSAFLAEQRYEDLIDARDQISRASRKAGVSEFVAKTAGVAGEVARTTANVTGAAIEFGTDMAARPSEKIGQGLLQVDEPICKTIGAVMVIGAGALRGGGQVASGLGKIYGETLRGEMRIQAHGAAAKHQMAADAAAVGLGEDEGLALMAGVRRGEAERTIAFDRLGAVARETGEKVMNTIIETVEKLAEGLGSDTMSNMDVFDGMMGNDSGGLFGGKDKGAGELDFGNSFLSEMDESGAFEDSGEVGAAMRMSMGAFFGHDSGDLFAQLGHGTMARAVAEGFLHGMIAQLVEKGMLKPDSAKDLTQTLKALRESKDAVKVQTDYYVTDEKSFEKGDFSGRATETAARLSYGNWFDTAGDKEAAERIAASRGPDIKSIFGFGGKPESETSDDPLRGEDGVNNVGLPISGGLIRNPYGSLFSARRKETISSEELKEIQEMSKKDAKKAKRKAKRKAKKEKRKKKRRRRFWMWLIGSGAILPLLLAIPMIIAVVIIAVIAANSGYNLLNRDRTRPQPPIIAENTCQNPLCPCPCRGGDGPGQAFSGEGGITFTEFSGGFQSIVGNYVEIVFDDEILGTVAGQEIVLRPNNSWNARQGSGAALIVDGRFVIAAGPSIRTFANTESDNFPPGLYPATGMAQGADWPSLDFYAVVADSAGVEHIVPVRTGGVKAHTFNEFPHELLTGSESSRTNFPRWQEAVGVFATLPPEVRCSTACGGSHRGGADGRSFSAAGTTFTYPNGDDWTASFNVWSGFIQTGISYPRAANTFYLGTGWMEGRFPRTDFSSHPIIAHSYYPREGPITPTNMDSSSIEWYGGAPTDIELGFVRSGSRLVKLIVPGVVPEVFQGSMSFSGSGGSTPSTAEAPTFNSTFTSLSGAPAATSVVSDAWTSIFNGDWAASMSEEEKTARLAIIQAALSAVGNIQAGENDVLGRGWGAINAANTDLEINDGSDVVDGMVWCYESGENGEGAYIPFDGDLSDGTAETIKGGVSDSGFTRWVYNTGLRRDILPSGREAQTPVTGGTLIKAINPNEKLPGDLVVVNTASTPIIAIYLGEIASSYWIAYVCPTDGVVAKNNWGGMGSSLNMGRVVGIEEGIQLGGAAAGGVGRGPITRFCICTDCGCPCEKGVNRGLGDGQVPGFFSPLAVGESIRVTSSFGMRNDPMNPGTQRQHNGIDIGPNIRGTNPPIHAIGAGKVTAVGWGSGGAGLRIWIDHGYIEGVGRVESVYMHNNANHVSLHDQVVAGQHIADMGTTGGSTGIHLHLGVRVDGVYVCPTRFIGNPP